MYYKSAKWAALLISLSLLVLPRLIPICDGLAGGKPMLCHYTYQAEFIVTLLAVIVAGSLFVLQTAEAKALAGVLLFLLGSSVIVLPQPWAIGLCAYGSCSKTAFFSSIAGALLALAGAAAAWLSYKEQRKTP